MAHQALWELGVKECVERLFAHRRQYLFAETGRVREGNRERERKGRKGDDGWEWKSDKTRSAFVGDIWNCILLSAYLGWQNVFGRASTFSAYVCVCAGAFSDISSMGAMENDDKQSGNKISFMQYMLRAHIIHDIHIPKSEYTYLCVMCLCVKSRFHRITAHRHYRPNGWNTGRMENISNVENATLKHMQHYKTHQIDISNSILRIL